MPKGVDTLTGYNYPQLISKFAMGAVFYNQACTNYLGAKKLSSKSKPTMLRTKKVQDIPAKNMFGMRHLAIGVRQLTR